MAERRNGLKRSINFQLTLPTTPPATTLPANPMIVFAQQLRRFQPHRRVARLQFSMPAVSINISGLRYKKGFVKTAGHVPTARLATSSIFLAKKGPKTFETVAKIKAAMSAMKGTGDAIAYCNSGQYSSALWFMMHELAGNKKARLYDGFHARLDPDRPNDRQVGMLVQFGSGYMG